MTASIPNGISMNELNDYFESATEESAIELAQPDADGSYTEEQIMEVVNNALEQITQTIPDPIAHKVAMIKIADNMCRWHTAVSQAALAEGKTESSEAWLRDGGKFQAVMDILLSIHLGDNDQWCPNNPG
jgi:agmatine/peptidylarginine deiminase